MEKDIVAGLGEIGFPILKLLSKKQTTIGYDLDNRLVNETKLKNLQDSQTSFLHIAIPVTSKFDSNLLQLNKKFKPECIVNRVSVERHNEDGDPVDILIEFPEKNLLLPNAREAGSVFRISSPIPYMARLVA